MDFDYKDIDSEGLSVLDAISVANKFNKWMYETIKPFVSGSILEIGSGVGNISQFFLHEQKHIYLSDIRNNYRVIIQNKFSLDDTRVINIDIVHPEFCNIYYEFIGKFDSIFCLNVIEHIEDDALAIKNMMMLLKNNGRLTVLVPAYKNLYNGIDISLEHYRRYNKTTLLKLMLNQGMLVKSFYFNAAGIIAWWISGKLLRNNTIHEGKMSLFNFFVPIFKLIDKLLFKKVGLSLVCVIQKSS